MSIHTILRERIAFHVDFVSVNQGKNNVYTEEKNFIQVIDFIESFYRCKLLPLRLADFHIQFSLVE